ncbi:TetR/AcrR family transcriptional regulator [Saccharibacillus sp. CPCC 101409]|uniref:TetR/AcrR family transcriptional regulator n=1 Tax=Saccharibacillus sp. CPCC 101409 TaxID=3058041 RepID=UPI002673EAC0|nr:TetR/AcrR family transcriptional regulator [Saccharibacillus sp. CPCC 101409]MDO3411546.1 TetR/AcrR family transcriptional regulator [Saccharibacillus sp. CPCC 101409]
MEQKMSARGATKEAFLSTSINLFNKYGFEQVTINRICKEINVTKTAFYYYFKSKDDLITEFFSFDRLISDTDLADLLSVADYADQAMKAMEIYVKHIVRLGVEMTKENYRIQLRNQVLPLDKSRSPLLGNLIPGLLQRAKEAGQIQNPAKAEELLDSMCNMANGVILNWAVLGGTFDILEETRKRFEILLVVKSE